MPPAQPGHLQTIQEYLSPARFQPYLDACDNDPQLALELYEWNVAISAAFWEVIALVEVTMRNAMHDRLTEAYDDRWYDNQSILDDRSLKAVGIAKSRAGRGLPAGAAPTPGKVVGEMSFGNWVALLDRGGDSTHEGCRLRYHDTLWLPALRYAFPSGLGHQRKTNQGLRAVQTLRNRIGHHEPIFKEPFKDTRLSLAGLHQHCLDVTGWISADLSIWVTNTSRVPTVLTSRPPIANP
ncbi:MAG: hypothetical protein IPO44_17055 [Candidatus Microthrix sp.]|nr:hypothetical protein [Candidatus Microthrix sp.]MBK9561189.1 hypothetical protein [Candidatus Microthrix sp.]